MKHSNVVGGSTAKRVIACPGSVKLVQKMPPQPSSVHADRGTMLHDVISRILLDTATDAGAPGVDPIFGAGILNIEKAMQAQVI